MLFLLSKFKRFAHICEETSNHRYYQLSALVEKDATYKIHLYIYKSDVTFSSQLDAESSLHLADDLLIGDSFSLFILVHDLRLLVYLRS